MHCRRSLPKKSRSTKVVTVQWESQITVLDIYLKFYSNRESLAKENLNFSQHL